MWAWWLAQQLHGARQRVRPCPARARPLQPLASSSAKSAMAQMMAPASVTRARSLVVPVRSRPAVGGCGAGWRGRWGRQAEAAFQGGGHIQAPRRRRRRSSRHASGAPLVAHPTHR